MSSLVRCDECGGEAEFTDNEGRGLGWLTVERERSIMSLGDDPGPWHFCWWGCMAEYARGLSESKPKARTMQAGENEPATAWRDQETIWGSMRGRGGGHKRGGPIFPTVPVGQMREISYGDPSSSHEGEGREEPRSGGGDLPLDPPLRRLSSRLGRSLGLRGRDAD